MNTTNQSTSSITYEQNTLQTRYKYWDKMDIEVSATESYGNLPMESLFSVALRVNKKRQFLFVSKLIAKHLAVHPSIALGTGSLLASLLMEKAGLQPIPQHKKIVEMIESGKACLETSHETLAYRTALPDKTVFIGMAETATGLGHSVFHHFDEAAYIHTTREEIIGASPAFVFEEEHSHATSHKVYAPAGMLEEADTIILIDDEISTGNTLVNLITALDSQFPGKKYISLSILDWRSEGQKRKLEDMAAARNLTVDVLSLLKGEFDLKHSESPGETEIAELKGSGQKTPGRSMQVQAIELQSATGQRYLPFTGRFGLSSSSHSEIGRWAEQLAETVPASKKPLVIGIGENMYLPLRFALALGGDASVQTTTRSPIFAAEEDGYPIKEKVRFKLPDTDDVNQFLYNISRIDADRIYLLAESVADEASWQPLISYLEKKAPVEWLVLTDKK
ncbi:phosphoribosyltransferase family protein [Planomicrobium okeanokoites]|uniref:phosphoribosyltransferase family protein n=1 Tax=Planomicrobium okeanokoites TaxID=244 RepID=UPI000A07A814|nr:phosphoribosyltransferase family protein [Planomicrobium okeanokoites]